MKSLLFLLLLLSACQPKKVVNTFPVVAEKDSLASVDTLEKEKVFISKEDCALLQPFIAKWLQFYHLDLSEAILISTDTTITLNKQPQEGTIAYVGEYDDSWIRAEKKAGFSLFYAPNRLRYIDFGYDCVINNGVLEMWRDVEQSVTFIDKKAKIVYQLLYLGVSSQAQDIFWLNNDAFVIVGNFYLEPEHFDIWYFDLKKHTEKNYESPANGRLQFDTYYPSTPILKAKAKGYRYEKDLEKQD